MGLHQARYHLLGHPMPTENATEFMPTQAVSSKQHKFSGQLRTISPTTLGVSLSRVKGQGTSHFHFHFCVARMPRPRNPRSQVVSRASTSSVSTHLQLRHHRSLVCPWRAFIAKHNSNELDTSSSLPETPPPPPPLRKSPPPPLTQGPILPPLSKGYSPPPSRKPETFTYSGATGYNHPSSLIRTHDTGKTRPFLYSPPKTRAPERYDPFRELEPLQFNIGGGTEKPPSARRPQSRGSVLCPSNNRLQSSASPPTTW